MLKYRLNKFFKFKLPKSHTLMAINFYVLLELSLFFSGALRIDVLLNVALFIFVVMPLPKRLTALGIIKIIRGFVSVILAVLLLWQQSWLPDINDSVVLLKQYGLPSFDYIFSFVERVLSMSLLLSLLILVAVSYVLRKSKLVSLVVLPLLVIFTPVVTLIFDDGSKDNLLIDIATAEAAEKMAPAEYLEEFYADESERVKLFKKPDPNGPAFDIVVLQVCSLSWRDLKNIGMSKKDKFFQQFDYLFSNFNSATGYSGPAMRRLLQANCGQRSHKDIHGSDTPKECLLFESIASVGYQTSVTMDHDGNYGDFISSVKENMPADTLLLSPEKLKPQAIFFDGKAKLYSDFDALKQWQDVVKESKPKRAALYYNTVLLHAGVRWIGEKTVSGRDPLVQFEDVALTLMDDVQAFIKELEESKRNTVVVFVPEHGRALLSSTIQLADIRDIPLPSITKVPVGIKLIGPNFNNKEQQEITKPTSYFALSWLLSKFIAKSPFAEKAVAPAKLAAKIPKTKAVSEHEGRVVMEVGEKTLYRSKDGKWVSLSKDQI